MLATPRVFCPGNVGSGAGSIMNGRSASLSRVPHRPPGFRASGQSARGKIALGGGFRHRPPPCQGTWRAKQQEGRQSAHHGARSCEAGLFSVGAVPSSRLRDEPPMVWEDATPLAPTTLPNKQTCSPKPAGSETWQVLPRAGSWCLPSELPGDENALPTPDGTYGRHGVGWSVENTSAATAGQFRRSYESVGSHATRDSDSTWRSIGGRAEARAQQAATAEILRVISSSPADLRRVFAEIAASAARLCDANDVAIHRVDRDFRRKFSASWN
jgi:hypothetical protein